MYAEQTLVHVLWSLAALVLLRASYIETTRSLSSSNPLCTYSGQSQLLTMSSQNDVDLTLYCVSGLPPNGWYVVSIVVLLLYL